MTPAMIEEFSELQFCIFDKPTYGVDADSRHKLADAILQAQEAGGPDQLLLVSHAVGRMNGLGAYLKTKDAFSHIPRLTYVDWLKQHGKPKLPSEAQRYPRRHRLCRGVFTP
jgi:hypothetical protein